MILLNLVLFVVGIWAITWFSKWLQTPKESPKAEDLRQKLNQAFQTGMVRQEPTNTRCGTGNLSLSQPKI